MKRELREIRKLADLTEHQVLKRLKKRALRKYEREFGLQALLIERSNQLHGLGNAQLGSFRFEEAQETYREAIGAAAELERWQQVNRPEEAEPPRLSLHPTWALGEIESLVEAYREPGRDPAPFERAMMGHRFDLDTWILERRRRERESRWLTRRMALGAAAAAGEAIWVDDQLAAEWFWLGAFDRAGAHAQLALAAYRLPKKERPRWFVYEGERGESFNRTAGIVELVKGRSDPSHLSAAALHFARALRSAIKNLSPRRLELVLLILIARHWESEDDPLASSFRQTFPWVEPVLARERTWWME